MWHVWGRGGVHAEFCWENEEEGPIGRLSLRWKDNIKMDFTEIEREEVEWDDRYLGRENLLWALWNWHKVREFSLLAGKLFTAHKALCSVELAG
jgi:hypothetical protein